LLECLAYLEAYIDFSEDEQLDNDLLPGIVSRLQKVRVNIANHLNDGRRGERLRNGMKVVIAGEPNVGKSSLLNNLTQRPAAIVSPIAGTTRDVIDTVLDINGYPVIMSDTAGLRESKDEIETEGVARAVQKLQEADLVILMMDSAYFQKYLSSTKTFDKKGLVASYCDKLKISAALKDISVGNILVTVNKIDLAVDSLTKQSSNEQGVSLLSCTTNDGIADFVDMLSIKLRLLCQSMSGSPSLTTQRHRRHLNKCVEYLDEGLELIGNDVVVGAEFVRFALNELSQITGKVSSEEILDVVFKDFCIGK